MTKEHFEYESYHGSIEVSLEDNCLHGTILFISDLINYEGSTLNELREMFEFAVDDYIETCKQVGKEPLKPCSGTFNVRIGPELHLQLSMKATLKGKSINEEVKEAVKSHLEDSPVLVNHDHRHLHKIDIKIDDKRPEEVDVRWKSTHLKVM